MPEPCLNCHHDTPHDADGDDGNLHCGHVIERTEFHCRSHDVYQEACEMEGRRGRIGAEHCWSVRDLCDCSDKDRRIAELEHEVFVLKQENTTRRATIQRLNRRAQKAEGEAVKHRKRITNNDEQAEVIRWLLDARKRELLYVATVCRCEVQPWARNRLSADLPTERQRDTNTWASPERQREAAERDRMMETVGKVGGINA